MFAHYSEVRLVYRYWFESAFCYMCLQYNPDGVKTAPPVGFLGRLKASMKRPAGQVRI